MLGPEGKEQLKVAGRVGAIGIEMALSMVIGYFGGRWFDRSFGTGPWLQWTGLGLGLAAAFLSLFRVARTARAQMESPPEED